MKKLSNFKALIVVGATTSAFFATSVFAAHLPVDGGFTTATPSQSAYVSGSIGSGGKASGSIGSGGKAAGSIGSGRP